VLSLEDYNQDLFNRIQISTEVNSTFAEEEFFNETSTLLSEAGVLDDVEYTPFKNSSRGMRIDGYAWNDLEKTINIILLKYSNLEEVETITQTELNKFSKSAYRFLENVDNEDFIKTLEETDDGRVAASSIQNYLEAVVKFRIVLITNNKLSDRVKKIEIDAIKEKNTSLEVWDLKRLHDIEESSSQSEPFTVNFKDLCGGLSALEAANNEEAKVKSYLCVMPGNVLSKLYDDFGQRLLESNVRTFLDFRSGVNKGIRRSLLMEPDNFFAFNNGLTVTASSIKTKDSDGSVLIEELENMQIVNGGQTTASIYFAKKDPGGIQDKKFSEIELEKIFIQMKLTVIENEELSEDMKSSISEYANTQNNIQTADLVSNHPFHKKLEELSRRMLMPAGESGVASKWFYERTRGQYNVKVRGYPTAGAKKQFQREFPKNQKFVKTDMAKYENTWRMNPHIVKKGAQANLKVFGEEISREYDKNPDNFKDPFYKDLIAKAILFKQSDSAILKSAWYKETPGFKAEVVTYSLAFIRHQLIQQKSDINLDTIYRNQKISETLAEEVIDVAKFIRDKITDTDFTNGVSNPSEFCKTLKAWEKFQTLEYDFKYLHGSDVANARQLEKKKEDDAEILKAGNQIEYQTEILKIPKEEWSALAEFWRSGGWTDTDPEISISMMCFNVHSGGRLPSEAQAKLALEIRAKAYDTEEFEF
tara:strand:- start:1746 stop:3854 length:2109 start_codon:yes stop_codon:yes gene_type:complete